jgi:hypothetical protein
MISNTFGRNKSSFRFRATHISDDSDPGLVTAQGRHGQELPKQSAPEHLMEVKYPLSRQKTKPR